MSKFTQVEASTDIIVDGKLLVKKGTKGMILRVQEDFKEFPLVRFCTGKMINLPTNVLMSL